MAEEFDPLEKDRKDLTDLRGKLVRADDALRCCRNQEKRLEGEILRIINEVIGIAANATGEEDLALVPFPAAVGLTTKLQAVPKTAAAGAAAPLVLGAVVLSTAFDLLRVAQTQAALEFGDMISRAIGQSLSRRRSSCYECLKNKTLPQNAPRQRQVAKILRRL